MEETDVAQRSGACATAATRHYSSNENHRPGIDSLWHEYHLREHLWSKSSDSQSCGPRPAALPSLGDIQDMWILRLYPDPLNEKLGCFHSPPGHFDTPALKPCFSALTLYSITWGAFKTIRLLRCHPTPIKSRSLGVVGPGRQKI